MFIFFRDQVYEVALTVSSVITNKLENIVVTLKVSKLNFMKTNTSLKA